MCLALDKNVPMYVARDKPFWTLCSRDSSSLSMNFWYLSFSSSSATERGSITMSGWNPKGMRFCWEVLVAVGLLELPVIEGLEVWELLWP